MEKPFRTHTTNLTDDELILFDVLFQYVVPVRLLARSTFLDQFNLGYAHQLTRDGLINTLRRLAQANFIERDDHGITLTPAGGELWSAERLPVWHRFARDIYPSTVSGKVMVEILSPSAQICDEFIESAERSGILDLAGARIRRFSIRWQGLIPWHPFPKLHVLIACGITISHSPTSWIEWERSRTWWRGVPELQKFLRT